MEFVNFLVLVVHVQNVQGFFKPYQTQNMDGVSVAWPFYYPTYHQPPNHFHVSLFFILL